jgi:hypothetical protein
LRDGVVNELNKDAFEIGAASQEFVNFAMITGACSTVCALIICFIRLRLPRSKDYPEDTRFLYSEGGTYEKIKRVIFIIALCFGIFLIPLGNIIGFSIYYHKT